MLHARTRNSRAGPRVVARVSAERPRPAGGFNEGVIEDFRTHHGQITKGPFAGRSLLLLTTRGAKTGHERTNPLAYTRDGDRIFVIASKGGAPTNPDWYRNLRANPRVTVELGPERFEPTSRRGRACAGGRPPPPTTTPGAARGSRVVVWGRAG